MACGPAGLSADIAALAEGYRLESLHAYDTLPQTPHVELIAKLVQIEEPAGV
jgi:tRNA/tmRNA/rRNA uracil-C5-methylase (TrmA/RlmC/RlmD family)